MPDATFFNFSLVLVVLAAALDVLANMLLARSDGFRRRGPGLLALMLVGLAFYCLSLAVRQLDLSVAYALWGALGLLGTSLGGWLLLRQRHGSTAVELGAHVVAPRPCGSRTLFVIAGSIHFSKRPYLCCQRTAFCLWRCLPQGRGCRLAGKRRGTSRHSLGICLQRRSILRNRRQTAVQDSGMQDGNAVLGLSGTMAAALSPAQRTELARRLAAERLL